MKVGGNYGKVISAWAFNSSAGTTVYEVQLHEDGNLTCNCPAWIFNKKNRNCKHTNSLVGTAEKIIKKQTEPIWQGKDVEKKVNPKFIPTEKRFLRRVV
jgi:hypothetical protein